ncbi:MAG TPA: hypothetical protein DDW36_02965 [Candidatus Magasanikbacteria bacterium]|nr:hypothetical protein [Candidatus Magasanikbacteria bacterium]
MKAFSKMLLFSLGIVFWAVASGPALAQTSTGLDFVIENIELRADNSVVYDVKNIGDATKPAGTALTIDHEWLKTDGTALNATARPQARIMREIQPDSVVHYDSRTVYPNDQISISGAYVPHRPSDAVQLRIALDQQNILAESNESNNNFFLNVPTSFLPDLTIEQFTYENGRLTFSIANRGSGAITNRARGGYLGFSVNHRWLNAQGAVVNPSGFSGNVRGYGRLFGSHVNPRTPPLYLQSFDAGASVLVDSAASGNTALASFVATPPRFATRLVVEVDSDRENTESNEDNNSASFDLAPVLYPDFVIESPVFDGAASVRLSVRNAGEGPAESLRTRGAMGYTDRPNDPYYQLYIVFDWLDENNNRLPSYAPRSRILLTDPFLPGATVVVDTTSDQSILPFLTGFRPREARKLRITLNPASHETNPDNNTYTFDAPLPNFVVSNAALNNGILTYSLTNQGGGYNPEQGVYVVYEWLKPDGSPATNLVNSYDYAFSMEVVPQGEILATGAAVQFNSQPVGQNHYNYMSGGQRVFLFEFLRRKPPSASQLRIRVQPPHTDASGATVYDIPESNIEDNRATVAIALPDIYVDGMTASADAVVLRLGNRGVVSVSDTGESVAANDTGFSYEFQWLNAAGEVLTPTQVSAPVQDQTYGFYKPIRPGIIVSLRRLDEGYPEAFDGVTFREIVVDARPLEAWALRIIADSGNTFAESDETNNTYTFVLPYPDLVVSSASLTLEETFEEFFNRTMYYLDFGYTVANQGGERTRLSFIPVVFQWVDRDGVLLGAPYNFELGSLVHSNAISEMLSAGRSWPFSERFVTGETVVGSDEVQFFAGKPADAAALRIILDSANIHDEGNENNNTIDVFLITPQTTAEELVEMDEDVEADDLDVEEPGVLPGSVLHPIERAGEFLRTALTFNTEKKVRLKERYASEKILEIKELAQKGKWDAALKHLKRYEKDIRAAKELVKKVEEENPAAAKTLALASLTRQLKHQKVLGVLEAGIPPEDSSIVKQTRVNTMVDVVETLDNIDIKDVQRAAQDAFLGGGSPFKELRDLEILKLAEAHAPGAMKDSLRESAERAAERAAQKLAGIGKTNSKLLDEYMDVVGGDEVMYVKVLDSVRNEARSEQSLDVLGDARVRILNRLEDKVERVAQKAPEKVKGLFLNVQEGTIEDVRVIKSVLDVVAPALAPQVAPLEQEVTGKFKERIKNLKTPEEQQEYFDASLRDVSDVQHVRLLDEIQDSVAPEDRAVIDVLKDKTVTAMRERLGAAVSVTPEEDALINVPVSHDRQVTLRVLLGDGVDNEGVLDDVRPVLDVSTYNALRNSQDELVRKKKLQEQEDERKAQELERKRAEDEQRLEADKKRTLEEQQKRAEDNRKKLEEEQRKQQTLDEQKAKDQKAREDAELKKKQEDDKKRADDELKRKQEEDALKRNQEADKKRTLEEQQKRDEEARKQAALCAVDTWECTPWSICFSDSLKIRTCEPKPGCEAQATTKPALEEQCTPSCKTIFWECGEWSACVANPGDQKNGTETRTCRQTVKCEGGAVPPVESRWCQPPAPTVTVAYPNTVDITINSEGFVFPSQLDIAAGGILLLHNYQTVSHAVRFSFENADRTIGKNSLDYKVTVPTKPQTYSMYFDGSTIPSVSIVVH